MIVIYGKNMICLIIKIYIHNEVTYSEANHKMEMYK